MSKQWIKRALLGGLCAVAAVFILILLLNLVLNSIAWGGRLDYYNVQFTFDRCAYGQFGSPSLAVLTEFAAVFLLGCAIGLSTLPFSETWTSMLGLSFLHFAATGGLSLLVGWSYGWFGFGPGGPVIVLVLYLIIYLLIWLIRWIVWYTELCQIRKALGLERKEN